MKINSNIPQLAQEKGWSYTDLAERAGINAVSAWRLLKGSPSMNTTTLAKLCLAFDVKPNDIVEIEK